MRRYVLSDVLASGGMSQVHIGRMRGPAGFGRTVAVKRLHAQLAGDPEFVSMMLDEARLVSRIVHPNVVPTLDVVHEDRDLLLVLEYVHGETLSTIHRMLAQRGERMPLAIVRAIASNVLLGLDAAHEARDERGQALGIVHRDVSPQNVMLGADGVARVLDFGIAKALNSSHQSEAGELKGKVAYMAPEQLRAGAVDRAADIYGASVVFWEMLTGRRLFANAEKSQIPFLVESGAIRSTRSVVVDVPEDIDDIVMKGLEHDPAKRWPTARAMAEAIEATGKVATTREVAEWIQRVAKTSLAERAQRVAKLEQETLVEPSEVRELAENIASQAQPASKRRWKLFAAGLFLSVTVATFAVAASMRGKETTNISVRSAAPAARSTDMSTGPVGTLVSSTPTPTSTPTSSATPTTTTTTTTTENSARPAVGTRPPTRRTKRVTASPATSDTPSNGLFERN